MEQQQDFQGVELTVVILVILLYFLPMWVAMGRDHPNRSAIAVLTLFGGWTLIGWLVALVWSVSAADTRSSDKGPKTAASKVARRPSSEPKAGSEATKTCPDCAETVKAAARVCRYCGYRFDGDTT